MMATESGEGEGGPGGKGKEGEEAQAWPLPTSGCSRALGHSPHVLLLLHVRAWLLVGHPTPCLMALPCGMDQGLGHRDLQRWAKKGKGFKEAEIGAFSSQEGAGLKVGRRRSHTAEQPRKGRYRFARSKTRNRDLGTAGGKRIRRGKEQQVVRSRFPWLQMRMPVGRGRGAERAERHGWPCLVREPSDLHLPDAVGVRGADLLVDLHLSPALLPAKGKAGSNMRRAKSRRSGSLQEAKRGGGGRL